jgi:hypothetical protein
MEREMTQPDKLTIGLIEAHLQDPCIDGDVEFMALQQLLDTMRENEQLRGIIESCECSAGEAIDDNPPNTPDTE